MTLVRLTCWVLVLASASSLDAQCQELLPVDGAALDRFGVSSCTSGNVLIVGAHHEDSNGNGNSGAAYMFRYDGGEWIEEQKLLASDGLSGDEFGQTVSVSGEVAIVGAFHDDDNGSDSGSAYMFRYDGAEWVEEQKLLAFDGLSEDEFGHAVSVSGDVAIVGARYRDDLGLDSGAVYVYRYSGGSWILEDKLLPSDGQIADIFGCAVSVSPAGDALLIGAMYNGGGAAYVYRFDINLAWVEEQILVASDAQSLDFFGIAVELSEDLAIIGASHEDTRGSNAGSAYVFRYNGTDWLEEQKLLASDGLPSDQFGHDVDIAGNLAVVGAPFHDAAGIDLGATYVFRHDGLEWTEEHKLMRADGTDSDLAGFSVSACGNDVAIGGGQEQRQRSRFWIRECLSVCRLQWERRVRLRRHRGGHQPRSESRRNSR